MRAGRGLRGLEVVEEDEDSSARGRVSEDMMAMVKGWIDLAGAEGREGGV